MKEPFATGLIVIAILILTIIAVAATLAVWLAS
jgi:hypothetical protein